MRNRRLRGWGRLFKKLTNLTNKVENVCEICQKRQVF